MRPWSDRVIGVSSLSKAWGTPGIRIGWLATRDAGLYETRLAAKKQIVVANSIVDETIALAALEGHDRWLPRLREGVLTARDNVAAWIDDSPFEWIPPGGGAVGFRRGAAPWASAGSDPRSISMSIGSMLRCSRITGRSLAPAIGSNNRGATCGSGSAGRRPTNSLGGLSALSAAVDVARR